jgi:predicted cobalt transporter CbtA
VTVFLVPFLKYPANPPATGDPGTIGRRTALWVVMLAWSVVATWAAWRAAGWLRARHVPEHRRVPVVVSLYCAVVVAGFVLLPGSPDVVTLPATLVWHFRLASVAGAAVFWAVLGTVFGWLDHRSLDHRSSGDPTVVSRDEGGPVRLLRHAGPSGGVGGDGGGGVRPTPAARRP